MARSICPKCGNDNFEIVENVPKKSEFRLMFIQCAACGAVVGVMDFFNIGELLRKIMKKLGMQ